MFDIEEECKEDKQPCSVCDGKGYIEEELDDDGDQTVERECPACEGTGYEEC